MPKTAEAYQRDAARFAQFLRDHDLPTDVMAITSRHVQAWANSMAGLAPSTIHRHAYATMLVRTGTDLRTKRQAVAALPIGQSALVGEAA